MGCRNTVFNSQPQSAARYLPEALRDRSIARSIAFLDGVTRRRRRVRMMIAPLHDPSRTNNTAKGATATRRVCAASWDAAILSIDDAARTDRLPSQRDNSHRRGGRRCRPELLGAGFRRVRLELTTEPPEVVAPLLRAYGAGLVAALASRAAFDRAFGADGGALVARIERAVGGRVVDGSFAPASERAWSALRPTAATVRAQKKRAEQQQQQQPLPPQSQPQRSGRGAGRRHQRGSSSDSEHTKARAR
jgi:hypothetical protein